MSAIRQTRLSWFRISTAALVGWWMVLASVSPARATEVIKTFDSVIRLNKDTSLDVTETIVMDFGDAQKHGIYRIIPVRYDRHGGSYSIYFKLQSVTDKNGNPYQYSTARQGRDINIKIGDPDRTITGEHTYRIRYVVRRAVNFFEGAPEVYWNVMGNEWPFAMQQAWARFYPPPGVAIDKIKTTSYIGPLGARTPGQIQKKTDHILFYTSNLNPSDGMTLVAGLPAGSVTPPSALQTLAWFLADWWPLFVLPLIALGIVGSQYLRSGRDEERGKAVAVEWNPPKNLSPAEVGTLVDEHCDMADIVSTLVDLAARGYLTIQETESTKFLFFSNKDYTFIRTNRSHDISEEPLLPHEQRFLQGVFGSTSGGAERVTLSSLKEKFYTNLPGIREGIYQSLTNKGLFARNPETVRSTYQGTGIFLVIGGVIGAIFGADFGLVSYGIGLALAGAIVFLAARAMPSKTAAGSQALRECLGFQRFVRLAEKDRIAVLAKEDPTVFGRLLPYAMVLGVADQWADAFKDLMAQPPDWYVPYGYGPGYHFSSRSFVNDLGGGMNTMGSTFSSAPKSTGGGGGSGFSGGGSGGGFGGGGGGSW